MSPQRVSIPAGLDSQRYLGPDWGVWLDRLPRLCADLLDEWELTVTGPARHGFCSIVLPVSDPDGTAAMLKVSFDGDDESEFEHLALTAWAGDGTVLLYRADPRRRAMLLERLHDEDLTDAWDLQACEIVAGLYPRLHVPALPQLRTVTSYVDRWLDDLAQQPYDIPIPRRLREQATSLGRDLVADPASVGTLIHGDLHYENVLAADREPWLVIDPKPMSGDAHYEVAPLLWNRWEEMTGDLRDSIRRRFHTVVDTAGLDEDRARDWVIVRMVLNAHWSVEDAQRMDRALSAEEQQWITRCISLVKAVQD